MNRPIRTVLFAACAWAMATDGRAFLRKVLSAGQMVNLSDIIVEGEVVESSPYSEAIVAAVLRVDRVLYGPDSIERLRVLGNPELPDNGDTHILGVPLKVGVRGLFFLRQVPRGLSREFRTLSRVWWRDDVVVLPPGEVDPRHDAFFVPFPEMVWPVGREAGADRMAELTPLLRAKLEADIERHARAGREARRRLSDLKGAPPVPAP
jgi:hypothetical protein